ncbi:MAG TPA: hypothetical protein VJ672_17005 [Gemmatimonadaceae bacterium]|nr:hypothetical protein [Gemmatimonadaceae bacterium]
MHRRRALIALLAALFVAGACERRNEGNRQADASKGTDSAPRVDPRCDGRELPPLSPGGVGIAQLGVKVSILARLCRVTDTSYMAVEGVRERAHVVHFGDHRVIAVSTGTRDTSIVRVLVYDSAFTTPQGIGVGSTIGEMRSFYPVLAYASGEGHYVVSIPSLPGISFAYDAAGFPADPSRALVRQPAVMDRARIESLWIFRPIGP